MSRQRGHIRERAGAYELRYNVGTDPATGKRKVITTTVRGTLKEAQAELTRLLKTLDDGAHINPNKITVRDWLGLWLRDVRDQVAPKTYERYAGVVRLYILPALGNHRLAQLASVHVQAFYAALGEGGRLAPRSRHKIHRVLSAALNRAVERQLVVRNICTVFNRRLPKVERQEMQVLSAAQSHHLLATLRDKPLYTPVLLAITTGMRRGEILGLHWRNADLDRGVVRVVEALEQIGGGIRSKPPKTGEPRSVTLPSFAVDELRRLKREQAEALLSCGIRQDGDTLVCAYADGSAMTPKALTNAFTRQVRLMPGLPRVRFHDLRHSHATQLLLAGVHPKVVQERLGHSSIKLTLDTYSHVLPSMQEDAAAKIDMAFRSSQ